MRTLVKSRANKPMHRSTRSDVGSMDHWSLVPGDGNRENFCHALHVYTKVSRLGCAVHEHRIRFASDSSVGV